MSNKIGCMLCRLAKAWQPAQKQLLRIASLFVCVVLLFSLMPIDSFAAEAQEFLVYNGYELPPPPDGVTNFVIFEDPYRGTYFLLETDNFFADDYEGDSTLYLEFDFKYRTNFQNSGVDVWETFGTTSSGYFSLEDYLILFSTNDIIDALTNEVIFHGSVPLTLSDATMYSYNGLIAESIFFDNWTDAHPNLRPDAEYAIIYLNSTDSRYYLAIFGFPPIYTSSNSTLVTSHIDIEFIYALDGTDWVFQENLGLEEKLIISPFNLIWTSFDIIDTDTSSIAFEASDPVLVGFETNSFTIVAQYDDYSLELGQSSLLQLYNYQGFSYRGDWSIIGHSSSGTSIIKNSPDANGLSSSATLQIAADETASKIVVYCSFINSSNLFTTKSFLIDIEPPSDASYSIIQSGNPFPEFVGGQVYYFSVIDVNHPTSSGHYADWSISGENINERTTIDSGVLSIAYLQAPTTITITASNIDHSGKSATYVLTTVSSGFDDGGGDSGSDASNQDIVDSLQDGFSNLGDKIDNLGNDIVSNLLEGLLRFFIPTAEDLSAQMDSFKSWIDEKIPILAVPVALVQFVYDLFFGVTPELGVMTFPQISWMDNILIEETHLDLNQYSWLNDLLPIIRTALTAACCFAFVNWIINKVGEVSKS